MSGCKITRQELQEKLEQSDYGNRALMFRTYFVPGSNPPLCIVCRRTIGEHYQPFGVKLGVNNMNANPTQCSSPKAAGFDYSSPKNLAMAAAAAAQKMPETQKQAANLIASPTNIQSASSMSAEEVKNEAQKLIDYDVEDNRKGPIFVRCVVRSVSNLLGPTDTHLSVLAPDSVSDGRVQEFRASCQWSRNPCYEYLVGFKCMYEDSVKFSVVAEPSEAMIGHCEFRLKKALPNKWETHNLWLERCMSMSILKLALFIFPLETLEADPKQLVFEEFRAVARDNLIEAVDPETEKTNFKAGIGAVRMFCIKNDSQNATAPSPVSGKNTRLPLSGQRGTEHSNSLQQSRQNRQYAPEGLGRQFYFVLKHSTMAEYESRRLDNFRGSRGMCSMLSKPANENGESVWSPDPTQHFYVSCCDTEIIQLELWTKDHEYIGSVSRDLRKYQAHSLQSDWEVISFYYDEKGELHGIAVLWAFVGEVGHEMKGESPWSGVCCIFMLVLLMYVCFLTFSGMLLGLTLFTQEGVAQKEVDCQQVDDGLAAIRIMSLLEVLLIVSQFCALCPGGIIVVLNTSLSNGIFSSTVPKSIYVWAAAVYIFFIFLLLPFPISLAYAFTYTINLCGDGSLKSNGYTTNDAGLVAMIGNVILAIFFILFVLYQYLKHGILFFLRQKAYDVVMDVKQKNEKKKDGAHEGEEQEQEEEEEEVSDVELDDCSLPKPSEKRLLRMTVAKSKEHSPALNQVVDL